MIQLCRVIHTLSLDVDSCTSQLFEGVGKMENILGKTQLKPMLSKPYNFQWRLLLNFHYERKPGNAVRRL
jgi:hypothetical protein